MILRLKNIHIRAGRMLAIIHESTAKILGLHIGDRIIIQYKGRKIVSLMDITQDIVSKGEIALSQEALVEQEIPPNAKVKIDYASPPRSHSYISKKMRGKRLKREEIRTIIDEIVSNTLTEAETAYFVLAVYQHGMNLKETYYLTESMYQLGTVLSWPDGKVVADKHSIGGIPGNRTTPLVVSICAAAGVTMPKSSSRAITSASGTADTIETLTNVEISPKRLKEIVKKTNGCFIWGGSLGLAPADDKLIRVERVLNVDPESQLIASILSKKLAVGSRYILIDIPYGKTAKVDYKSAKNLRKKFLKMAKKFKVKARVVLTDGSQPIGDGIGPNMEMVDILKILNRKDGPKDLEEKSLILAGEILELTGKAEKSQGKGLALQILDSKMALKKFNEIVDAQGRKRFNPRKAKQSYDIKASKPGKLSFFDNRRVNRICRILGCPEDRRAGIYLNKHLSDGVKKGEIILTLYSESEHKLEDAKHYCREHPLFELE